MTISQKRTLKSKYVASQWNLVKATDAASLFPGDKDRENAAIVAKRVRDSLLNQMDAAGL